MTTVLDRMAATTPKRSGYWRNHYWSQGGWIEPFPDGVILVSKHEYGGRIKWHCPQVAEEAALKSMREATRPGGEWAPPVKVKYLGPKHYNDKDERTDL